MAAAAILNPRTFVQPLAPRPATRRSPGPCRSPVNCHCSTRWRRSRPAQLPPRLCRHDWRRTSWTQRAGRLRVADGRIDQMPRRRGSSLAAYTPLIPEASGIRPSRSTPGEMLGSAAHNGMPLRRHPIRGRANRHECRRDRLTSRRPPQQRPLCVVQMADSARLSGARPVPSRLGPRSGHTEVVSILVGTEQGLLSLDGGVDGLTGQPVSAVSGQWVLVGDRQLVSLASGVEAKLEGPRARCVLDVGERLYVGTAEARLFAGPGTTAELAPVESFDRVETRDEWYTPWGAAPDTRSLAAGRTARCSSTSTWAGYGGTASRIDGPRSSVGTPTPTR